MWIRKKDEAVSPVVAFMLLLMVVVSFISILNAYYIPSMKQQAEIEHLNKVEESFQRVSTNMLQVTGVRQNFSLKEPVMLGGGDVLFSPVKSSGYLEINTTLQQNPLTNISVIINDANIPKLYSEINRTKVIYHPVGNFWINQSYKWEDGVLNVTKGTRSTYLQYPDDNSGKADDERRSYYEMLQPRISFQEFQNNITSIQIDLVHCENPLMNRTISSNGAGTIWMEMKESSRSVIPIEKGNSVRLNVTDLYNDDLFSGYTPLDKYFNLKPGRNNTVWDITRNTPVSYSIQVSDNFSGAQNITITRWNLSIHT